MRLELCGLEDAATVRAAVLALHGADPAELRRAAALSRTFADRRLLVAVDGGLDACVAAGRRPDLFVGDGDSCTEPTDGVPCLRFERDKDFSDLAGALRAVRLREVRVVVVAGLLGGRVDHEWANLFELGRAGRHFAAAVAPTGRGLVVVTSRGCRAATVPGRPVSLFGLGGGAEVTLRGTRWELARQRIRPGSRGLSNEAGKSLDLTVHAGVVALVFPA